MKISMDYQQAANSRVITGYIIGVDGVNQTAGIHLPDKHGVLVTRVFPSTTTIQLGQNLVLTSAAVYKVDDGLSFSEHTDFEIISSGISLLTGGSLLSTVPMSGWDIRIAYSYENKVYDIPIHYTCNHGLTNHGHLVFSENDNVLMLYTGQGAAPSATNMVVVGLQDEIRLCRVVGGCLLQFKSGVIQQSIYEMSIDDKYLYVCGFVKPNISNKVFLTYNTVDLNSSAAAANIDWTGSKGTVTWEWSVSCRYSYGAMSGNIYIDGVKWDTAPGLVVGAAINNLYGADTIVAVTKSGVFIRRRDKRTSWQQLSGGVLPTQFLQGAFFDPGGTCAVSLTTQNKLVTINVSLTSVSITIAASSYTMTGTSDDYTETATIGADYSNGSVRYIKFKRVYKYTKTTEDTFISNCPNVEGGSLWTTNTRKILSDKITIEPGNMSELIVYKHEKDDSSNSLKLWYNYGGSYQHAIYELSIASTVSETTKSSIIADIDIRYSKLSFFTHDFSVNGTGNVVKYTGGCNTTPVVPTQTEYHYGGTMVTSKTIDGSTLFNNNYTLVYPENSTIPNGFNRASDNTCEPIQFDQTGYNPFTRLSVKTDIDEVFIYAANGKGLPVSAVAPGGAYYRSWLYSSTEPSYVRSSSTFDVLGASADTARVV